MLGKRRQRRRRCAFDYRITVALMRLYACSTRYHESFYLPLRFFVGRGKMLERGPSTACRIASTQLPDIRRARPFQIGVAAPAGGGKKLRSIKPGILRRMTPRRPPPPPPPKKFVNDPFRAAFFFYGAASELALGKKTNMKAFGVLHQRLRKGRPEFWFYLTRVLPTGRSRQKYLHFGRAIRHGSQ